MLTTAVRKVGAARQGVAAALGVVHDRVDSYSPAVSSAFVFLPLLLIYLATATYDGRLSPDPIAAAVPAWQFAAHGNLTLDAFDGMVLWFVEAGDRIVSNRTAGVIFFSIPFYWLFGTGDDFDIRPSIFAAAFAAAAAMTLLHLAFRRLVATSQAMLAAYLAALGTATWSVSADALWAHGPNQLWLGIAMFALAAERYWVSGGALGLGVLTRPHLAVVAAVTGLVTALQRRSVRPLVYIGLASSLGLAALLYYNSVVFGTDRTLGGGYGSRPVENLVGRPWWHYGEDVAGMLASPQRGLLVMSPFLLLLLPGVRDAWRSAPAWVRTCAVGGLLYMLVQLRISWYEGGVHVFSGGQHFYSYRLSLEFLTLMAPLLVLCYREWTTRTHARRRWFSALALLSIAFHLLGAAFYRIDYVERSAWTDWKVWDAMAHAGPVTVTAVFGICVLLWLLTGGAAAQDDHARMPG